MAGPVETIFTVVILVGIAVAVVIAATPSGAIGARLSPLRLPIAAIATAGATAGSLYFSESRLFEPCEYCWYQRIAMYPLGALLVIAAIRRDWSIRPYALMLASAGALISTYHYRLQMFPGDNVSCDPSNPCSFQWIDVFGFVSIPLMALGCFVITILVLARPDTPLPQEATHD